jgi:signal transduction histidine kinase
MKDPTSVLRPVDKEAPAADWLAGGGEMGSLVRSKDWSQTPLGPIESWPQSLRTTVSLCLASNFPISLAWGPHHVQIYNDGYWPICGGKHPHAMGQDFSACWASAWPVIGKAFERALAGDTSYLENQRMFLDRHGYLEETFFTFSFSPIRDETGGVGGLFHPVTETTAKMLAERRTRALRDLAGRTGKARTTEEALEFAAQALSEYNLDVPFALFYLLDDNSASAELIAGTASLPEALATRAPHLEEREPAVWPLLDVVRTHQVVQADDLAVRCGEFSCEPYPEPPKTALLLPITPPGSSHPIGIMVAGVSARLPLNDLYRSFYDLMVAAVTAAVANARAYEEERRRAEALAEIDRAKTAFFSNVSHEFRTPLTLILGPLEDELAECDSSLPLARRERLATAHRNSLRLMKLVNSLLDFARIEAGRVEANYEPTDLARFTAELASVFRSAVEKGGLALTVECPPLAQPIYVDRDMWEKIVLNLLSNAFKHTFEGGICVRLRGDAEQVELSVQDSGVGIPQGELPHLFDRFHRVKGAKSRSHEGSGIGLALVQELVRIHDGKVRVRSEEGRGSEFLVSLKVGHSHLPSERLAVHHAHASPARRATAYVEEALHWISNTPSAIESLPHGLESPSEPAPSRQGDAHVLSRPRILWADDNADMRNYVGRLLATHYEVTAVSDGAQALTAARAAPPELILTDVMMPVLDGFGLLRELRADERTRTIPIILLSARAGEESAVEGLQAGADDYLVKPFSARELLARVRTHLELAQLRREWTVALERQVRERTAELFQTCRDLEVEVTERKQAERKLLETQQVMMQQERLRALGEMASGIAHDINNAISPAALYTESLLEREPGLSERARSCLTTIQIAIEDVAETVSRMREFYRPRETEMVLSRVTCNRVLEQVINLTRARWSDLPQQRGVVIQLQTELAEELPQIMGSEVELRDALTNLIFNAVDAMPEGGTLTLRTRLLTSGSRAADDVTRYVQLEVADTGIGMDEETRRRCIEPFYTTKGERGTGLGLAMVYGMVTRHSAELDIDSAVGRGTTVRLSFAAADALTVPLAAGTLLQPIVQQLRILLVDDDPMLIKSLRDILEQDGHVVTVAEGGQQGIEAFAAALARGTPFSIVITDLGMPYVDGRKVAASIKAASARTPVIMLTGWGKRLLAENDIPAHVDRVLSKPPRLGELRAALAKLILPADPADALVESA